MKQLKTKHAARLTKTMNNVPAKAASKKKPATKQTKIISLLQRQKGATLAELTKITSWQEHSIRGFISGTLKKRMGLDIFSQKDGKGIRRYRIGTSELELSSATSLTSIDTGGQA